MLYQRSDWLTKVLYAFSLAGSYVVECYSMSSLSSDSTVTHTCLFKWFISGFVKWDVSFHNSGNQKTQFYICSSAISFCCFLIISHPVSNFFVI